MLLVTGFRADSRAPVHILQPSFCNSRLFLLLDFSCLQMDYGEVAATSSVLSFSFFSFFIEFIKF